VIWTLLLALPIAVVLIAVVFSLVRDRPEDDEPATLEGGSSHLRS
jgi:hypothetical protein